MFWTKTWQKIPRWLHSRRRSRNLSVRWIGKSNLHQNQIGKNYLHQNQIGKNYLHQNQIEKNYLHQNQNQIIKNNLHQNQAFVVRCEGKSLFWKSWSKQILKLSLKCQTSILSRTRSWTWRWDNFQCGLPWFCSASQLRKDDVWIVTPPKCGTTWTQVCSTSKSN